MAHIKRAHIGHRAMGGELLGGRATKSSMRGGVVESFDGELMVEKPSLPRSTILPLIYQCLLLLQRFVVLTRQQDAVSS